ncbi:hypothetical protein ACKKBG_A00730 [Auxenochlorella protothecoides x Auxenochlorella symbiontica]
MEGAAWGSERQDGQWSRVALHSSVPARAQCPSARCVADVIPLRPSSFVSRRPRFAVLEPGADLAPLRAACQMLRHLNATEQPAGDSRAEPGVGRAPAASAGPAPKPAPAGGAGPAAGSPSASCTVPAAAPPFAGVQPAPARRRATRVVLPSSVEREVPPWFFERTGAELKAAFLGAARRRQEEQVLMTAAMRERAAARARAAAGTRDHAVVRVRLPEGISLQGEFDGREPVAAVLQWVTDSLSDPMNTFELALPGARGGRLDPGAGATVRSAGLVPSVVLNFRWTGESARAMRSTPTLRPDLCTAALSAAD